MRDTDEVVFIALPPSPLLKHICLFKYGWPSRVRIDSPGEPDRNAYSRTPSGLLTLPIWRRCPWESVLSAHVILGFTVWGARRRVRAAGGGHL